MASASCFIAFLGQIGFAEQVQTHLPFAEPTSNNAIPRAHSLTAFLMAVVASASRFAHSEWLRADRLLRCPATGFSLDLDSTVFCREGKQEGARKGFNPRRKGRNSNHPLLAVLAEAQFILHGWLRSGNTGAARGTRPAVPATRDVARGPVPVRGDPRTMLSRLNQLLEKVLTKK